MENSEFVTDEEILEYWNQENAELRGELRLAEGQTHVRRSQVYNYVSGTLTYALPDDFWELLSVEARIGGISRRLEPFMEVERARLLNAQLYAYSASPQYRIEENQIELLPSTQSFEFTIRYAPNSPRLVLGRIPPDEFDGYNGYEMVPIYGTCATVLSKEESDPSFYLGLKDRLLRLIRSLAAQRDASSPERVTDVVGLTNILPLFPWE
jgi:hypothetical protein